MKSFVAWKHKNTETMRSATLYKRLTLKFYIALGAMLLITVVGNFYIFQSCTDHFSKLIQLEFQSTSQGVTNFFSLLGQNNSVAVRNIAVDEKLSQALNTLGKDKIQTRIIELQQLNNIDMVILFDPLGAVVASSSKYALSDNDMGKLSSVSASQYSQPIEFQFITLEKQLVHYQTNVLTDGPASGSYLLLTGLSVDSVVLHSMQNNSRVDISVLVNDTIQSSTKDDFVKATIPAFSKGNLSGDSFFDQSIIKKSQYFTKRISFSEGNDQAENIFLLTYPIEGANSFSREVIVNLMFFLTLQVVFFIVLSLFFAKNFLSSVRNLTATIANVSKGKCGSRLDVELDMIFENSSQAIMYEDQGRIARVNKAFEKMFHFDRQEVLGQQWKLFFSGLQKGKKETFWDEQTEVCYVENKTGEKLWITLNKRSSDSNDPEAGVIWTFEDISKQKEAELKVKQLSLAVEQSSNSVVITDTSGAIQYVNPAFTHITGYTFDEAIGQNPSILKSGKTSAAVFESMWKTITSGEEWSGQFINKKKNGEFYEEHVTIAPIRNEQNEITNFIATKENISMLKEAHRQADLANQAKGEFLANMSHEIRTPMNLIFGMTELLLDTELQVEQKDFLGRIQSAATNLLGLINDILDYSKIESGKLVFEKRVIAMEQLFSDLEGALSLVAGQKGLDLRLCVENVSGCSPIGDRLRVHQVLMNLVANAIKFTDKGKVEAKVTIKESDKNYCIAQFTVKDTGIGITAKKQEYIFDSFSQANSSVTREYGGSGLGLSISSKLVDLMGGEIKLSSAPGLGSIFSFTLRFPKGEREEPVTKSEVTASTPNIVLSVLLVEDNVANQELARLILQKDKHNVTISENGLDALHKLTEKHFDVILMDVQMPVMDGLTATAIIRKFETNAKDPLPEHPLLQTQLYSALSGQHIAIIAMTANAMTGDREKCMAAGTDNYLTKPYSTIQLREALAEVQNSLDLDLCADFSVEEQPEIKNTTIVSRETALTHLQENFSITESGTLAILDTFVQSISRVIPDLSQALQEKDAVDIAKHAHQLKGSLLNLGMSHQAMLVQKLEDYALENQLQDCHVVLEELQDGLKELLSS